MYEFVIYFWDGNYFQCYADSKSDALSYLYQCFPYIIKEEIQNIKQYDTKC